MFRNLGTNKILWLLTALLSLVAALVGVLSPGIYSKVVSADLMPGVFGQDLITIVASLAILFLAIRTRKEHTIKQILIMGIIGYLFYAYGIYAIERVYNMLYYLYLAIFGLSFWSLAFGVGKIDGEILRKVRVSGLIRNLSAGFSLFVALVFISLWIIQLLPLVQTGEKIEFLYSVYVLDLCFIMPAFVIVGITAIRKTGLGLLLIPSIFVLGFTLIFSLAVSELVKPLYGLSIDISGLGSSLILSIVFLVLAAFYLRSLKIDTEKS
jgi:hypothetical protein